MRLYVDIIFLYRSSFYQAPKPPASKASYNIVQIPVYQMRRGRSFDKAPGLSSRKSLAVVLPKWFEKLLTATPTTDI